MTRYTLILLFVLSCADLCAQHVTAPKPSTPRPKIGLALGGGGAKGFAHISVLKLLEENNIPIDYIAGTSMGAIIGGLYASGLSPEEIERRLTAVDWWTLLNDATPRRDLNFRRKSEDARYNIGLELGFNKGQLSMPIGLAAGQKFNNLMQALTLDSASVERFDDLPIPFRAVATDLKTGEMVLLDHGNLGMAMRASMAVPGAYTPVVQDGRTLIDGGIVMNIPVDVVREMGADIVIAVDLGAMDAEASSKNLSTLAGILGHTYQLMRRPVQDQQMAKAEVGVRPDVSAYSTSAFYLIKEIIAAGMEGAELSLKDLKQYSVDETVFNTFLTRHRRDKETQKTIRSLCITGNEHVDARVIREMINAREGAPLNLDAIGEDLRYLYGLGDFEQVLFVPRSVGGGGYDVEYRVREKEWGPGYLKFGLQLESDFNNNASWGLLMNYNRTRLNALGAEWSTDLEVGNDQKLYSEFYQPLDFKNRFFIAPSVDLSSEIQDVFDGDRKIGEYDVDTGLARLDLGMQLRKYAEVRFGLVLGTEEVSVETGAIELPEVEYTVGGWVGELRVDRLDRVPFPREGYSGNIHAFIAREELGSDTSYEKLLLHYRHYMSRGRHTFSFGGQAGTSFSSDVPVYDAFRLGGFNTFPGVSNDQLRGQYMGAVLGVYQNLLLTLPPSLGKGVYLVVGAGAGNVWDDTDAIDEEGVIWTSMVALGADVIMGPIVLAYGQAEGGVRSVYFSLGSQF